MRTLFGKGTPRALQGRLPGFFSVAEGLRRLLTVAEPLVNRFSPWLSSQPIGQEVLHPA